MRREPQHRSEVDADSAVRKLRAVIAAYRGERWSFKLDKQAHDVLTRLADSREAAISFARLKLKDQREWKGTPSEWESILTTCIWVDKLAREFSPRVADEQKMLDRLEQYDNAVAELRGFVAQQTKSPSDDDLLTESVVDEPAVIAAMTRGLDLIGGLIDLRRRIAKDTDSRLGATRDKHYKESPNNAAIQHLAEEVDKITGKPHRLEVATLAEVILGTTRSVTVDRVRGATRREERSGSGRRTRTSSHPGRKAKAAL